MNVHVRYGLRLSFVLAAILGLSLVPAAACAQDDDEGPPGASSRHEIVQPNEPAREDDVDVETATPDPTPEAAEVNTDQEVQVDVIEQAGVGGPVNYGATGVLEVGGAGSLWADDSAVWSSFRPYIGLFVVDGVQLSYSNELIFTYGADEQLRASIIATVEPSVHLPIYANRVWFAVGVGGGVLYNGANAGAIGTGRVGLDVLVGRSSMLHLNVLGQLASEPLARPASTTTGQSIWRLGAEISYAALF